jgi:hypothetical protein
MDRSVQFITVSNLIDCFVVGIELDLSHSYYIKLLLVTYLHLYYLRVDVVCLQWIRLGIKGMLRLELIGRS